MSDLKQLIDLDNEVAISGHSGVDDFLKLIQKSSEYVALVITTLYVRRKNRFEKYVDFSVAIQKYTTATVWSKIPLLWEVATADDLLAVVASQKQAYSSVSEKLGINLAIILVVLSAGRRFQREGYACDMQEFRIPMVFSDVQHIVPEDDLKNFSLNCIEPFHSWDVARRVVDRVSRFV